MTRGTTYLCLVISVVPALGSAACSTASPERSRIIAADPAAADAVAFAAPTQLTAVRTDPSTIVLSWKNNATVAGGCFIEFSMGLEDNFTLLDAVWADTTTFRHQDLAPETSFNYRIRPFHGPVSNVVGVTTGRIPKPALNREVEGPLESEGPSSKPKTAPETAEDTIPKKSLKTTLTAAQAAPADLTATVSSATSVVLRWKDRAKDEDGYLVEIAPGPKKEFTICALLPPDTTSFRKIQLPPQIRCYFRTRAYFYGKPSNLAMAKSGR